MSNVESHTEHTESNALTRRQFMAASAASSGGLLLGFSLTGCSNTYNKVSRDGIWQANAWLEITPESEIIFTLDRVEMGQGTYTGLTTLIAEELEVEPSTIKVVFAGAKQVYRNPDYGLQITGGSNSLSTSWLPLRTAAASAREMLISAGSDVLSVQASELHAESAQVVHAASGKKLKYGELAKLASSRSVVESPKLKPASGFKWIGKQNKRLDSAAKVAGEAGFGIDVNVDGMRFAIVKRAPSIGATVASHNGETLVGKQGIEAVVEIDSGVAIVAQKYWQARQAESRLEVQWKLPEERPNTDSVFALYRSEADKDDAELVREVGDIDDASAEVSQFIESEYECPFLAHATMEPMNCTAHVQEDRADIWVSTQGPDIAQVVVARVSHLGLDDVHIHNQFIGGGFGRRLSQDFVGEAAEISVKAGGPIKLIWSREEDMQNDFYRPASLHRLKAGIDQNGQVKVWQHHVIAPGVMDWYVWNAAPAMFSFAPKFMYPMLGKVGLATAGTPMTPADRSAYEGADDLLYSFDSQEVKYTKADAGIPITYWRSVGHSHNGFVTESFVDELAAAANKDELAFRLELLKDSPRMRGVLKKVAKEAGWGQTTKQGDSSPKVHQGVACHKSFGSYVAHVVDMKIENQQIVVEKVVSAIDCGFAVNPDIVRMQMESCVIFGLTAALYGEITFKDGMAEQTNFHDYEMLRMNQTPIIETHIIDSEESPTGVGEPGLPPLAPALASALYKATGKRSKKLPLRLS